MANKHGRKKRKLKKCIILFSLYLCISAAFSIISYDSVSAAPGVLMAAANSQRLDKENQAKEKNDEEKKSPEIIHEIEVVAKRAPEARFKTDRSVTIMPRGTMKEQTPRTLPEALHDTPGTFVQQTNMGGGSPIIRGMIGPQLLIMVDGIRFNNSTYRTGPGQYLNLIDPLSIDRIEVLRGPGSVLYGSDAMGGVIQVTSLSGMDTPGSHNTSLSGNLLSRYQSANKGSVLHGNFEYGHNGFTIIGGGGYKKFNGLEGGSGIGVQPYVGYDHSSAVGKIIRRFSTGFFLAIMNCFY